MRVREGLVPRAWQAAAVCGWPWWVAACPRRWRTGVDEKRKVALERSGGAPWSAWGEGAIVSEDTVRGLAVRWLLLPANLSRLRERNARWLVACAVGISAMCGAAGVPGVLRLAPRWRAVSQLAGK